MDAETKISEEEVEAAHQIIPGVTPDALLDVMENPEAFAELARADLYVQMAYMRKMAAHPEFSNSQRLEYAKFLSRMGQVDAPKAGDLGGMHNTLPMISITFPSSGGQVNIGAAPMERVEKDITPDEPVDTGFGSGGKPSSAVLP